jgi:hypothetical protein
LGGRGQPSIERVSGQPELHTENNNNNNNKLWSGEMSQRLRALAALPEVLSSIPSNHMVAPYNEIWCPLLACRHTCRQNALYIVNKSLKRKKKKKGNSSSGTQGPQCSGLPCCRGESGRPVISINQDLCSRNRGWRDSSALLLLRSTRGRLPAPTWWFTTMLNTSSSKDPDTLFRHLCPLRHAQPVSKTHVHFFKKYF